MIIYSLRKDEAVIFSTQPLDGDNWKLVPFTRMLAYRDGELIRQGEPHGNYDTCRRQKNKRIVT